MQKARDISEKDLKKYVGKKYHVMFESEKGILSGRLEYCNGYDDQFIVKDAFITDGGRIGDFILPDDTVIAMVRHYSKKEDNKL